MKKINNFFFSEKQEVEISEILRIACLVNIFIQRE